MRHRKTTRTQASAPPATRVKGWQQLSLLDRSTLRQITWSRWEAIQDRLAREKAHWALYGDRTGPEGQEGD